MPKMRMPPGTTVKESGLYLVRYVLTCKQKTPRIEEDSNDTKACPCQVPDAFERMEVLRH